MSDSVDAFVMALDGWKRIALEQLVNDIRSTAHLGEHLKWGNPYFELDGSAILKTYCASSWINVYFFRGSELEDPAGLFEPTSNARMRTIRITAGKTVDRKAVRDLVTRAVQLSRTHYESDNGSRSNDPGK